MRVRRGRGGDEAHGETRRRLQQWCEWWLTIFASVTRTLYDTLGSSSACQLFSATKHVTAGDRRPTNGD